MITTTVGPEGLNGLHSVWKFGHGISHLHNMVTESTANNRALDGRDCKCALRLSCLYSDKRKLDDMWPKNMGPLAAEPMNDLRDVPCPLLALLPPQQLHLGRHRTRSI